MYNKRLSIFNVDTEPPIHKILSIDCVQESPVHTLGSLDTLLSMASKKGKRESVLAVGEFTDD